MRLFVLCTAAAAASACESNMDCELNGECRSGQNGNWCACDYEWEGETCGQMRLDPPQIAYGGPSTDFTSWGGGPPIYDYEAGRWVLFVSEIAEHCGLSEWKTRSTIVRATANSVNGPYVRESVVVPAQAHNAYYAYDPSSGAHIIYHIGDGRPQAEPRYDCWAGTTPTTDKAAGDKSAADLKDAMHWQAYNAGLYLEGERKVSSPGAKAGGAGGQPSRASGRESEMDGELQRLGQAAPGSRASHLAELSRGAPLQPAPVGQGGKEEPSSSRQSAAQALEAMPQAGAARSAGMAHRHGGSAMQAAANRSASLMDTYEIFEVGPGETILAAPPKFHYAWSLEGPWLPSHEVPGYEEPNLAPGSYYRGEKMSGLAGPGGDNPAPFVFPNGTVLLLSRWYHDSFKGTKVANQIFLSRAPSFRGPFEVVLDAGDFSRLDGLEEEDPCIWQDWRGNFHALFHFTGSHAFSWDGLHWHWGSQKAWQGGFMPDGTFLNDAERPRVWVNQTTGRPEWLFFASGGAKQPVGVGTSEKGFTVVRRIRGEGDARYARSSTR